MGVLVLLQVDALAPHVREAKYAVCLGSNPRDYTNKEKLIKVGSCWVACQASNVQAAVWCTANDLLGASGTLEVVLQAGPCAVHNVSRMFHVFVSFVQLAAGQEA